MSTQNITQRSGLVHTLFVGYTSKDHNKRETTRYPSRILTFLTFRLLLPKEKVCIPNCVTQKYVYV